MATVLNSKQHPMRTLLSRADRVFLADFEKIAKRHTSKVTRSRETAMQELIDAGIYGRDGKLRKQYR